VGTDNQSSAVLKTVRNYFAEFALLRGCGREFWVVQIVNLFDCVAYFATMTVGTLYLSETLGYTDNQAAWVWALCMWVYTGVGFIAGFIGDSFGIRRTLYLSVLLLLISRTAVWVTDLKLVIIPALFVLSVGAALMTPILISATKRYTTKETQTSGFNLLYFLMNIGAFFGNFFLDALRGSHWGNRSVFMLGSGLSIVCWLCILIFWRKGIARVDAATQAQRAEQAEEWEAPWTIAISVFQESAFWRFMLFLVILTGVRQVFEHQYQVYPKYYQRTMSQYVLGVDLAIAGTLDEGILPEALTQALAAAGHDVPEGATVRIVEARQRWELQLPEGQGPGPGVYYLRDDDTQIGVYASDAPIGLLNSINPFIICFGVVISTPIVARFKLFNVMFVGIVFSSASMLTLCISPEWFAGVFGLNVYQGYTAIILAQVVVFSIGEVIWSPRLYEYTAAIAPPGREASYMGLSYVPMFFARLAEGPLAGLLLTKYCPPDIGSRLTDVPYTQGPQMMNLILAAMALSTPVLIVLFRGVIQKESRLEQQAEPGAGPSA